MYVDGKNAGSQNGDEFKTTMSSVQSVFIGQEKNRTTSSFVDGHWFTGAMSRVNIWDKVLPVSDMVKMAQSCIDTSEGNLLSWARIVENQLNSLLVFRRSSTCPLAKGTTT